MDDASAVRRRRTLLIRASIVIGVALVLAIATIALVVLPTDGNDNAAPARGTASLALERLDANGGESYVGTIDDAADPARLRRALRAEFRSGAERATAGRAKARAQRCASELRGSAADQGGRVVLLADTTLAGRPAVVVGITDRGRVVVFVADAATCEVLMAQSL